MRSNDGEVAVAVEREAVHRDAARDPDADRGDLAVRPSASAGTQTPLRPSTRTRLEAELGADVDEHASSRRT